MTIGLAIATIFAVLKLSGTLVCSWWLVLLPIAVEFGFYALIIIALIVLAVLFGWGSANDSKPKSGLRIKQKN